MSLRAPLLVVFVALVGVCGCIEKTRLPDPTADDDDVGDDDDTGSAGWPDDDTQADDDTVPQPDCQVDYADIPADPDGSLIGLVSLSQQLQPAIDLGCDCHQVGNQAIEDLSPGRVWGAWVEQPSQFDHGAVLVVPGSPEMSAVFWKVFDCYPVFPYVGVRMPPNAPALSLDEVALYYNWILQGAEDN
jgi:hypothetical protein